MIVPNIVGLIVHKTTALMHYSKVVYDIAPLHRSIVIIYTASLLSSKVLNRTPFWIFRSFHITADDPDNDLEPQGIPKRMYCSCGRLYYIILLDEDENHYCNRLERQKFQKRNSGT